MRTKTILHFDPDKYYQNQLREIISGYEVLSFPNFAMLRSENKKNEPELIITEMILDGGHGYDLLEYFRSQDNYRNTPIIIYTKLSDIEDVTKTMQYGISGFFVKGSNHISELTRLAVNLLEE